MCYTLHEVMSLHYITIGKAKLAAKIQPWNKGKRDQFPEAKETWDFGGGCPLTHKSQKFRGDLKFSQTEFPHGKPLPLPLQVRKVERFQMQTES